MELRLLEAVPWPLDFAISLKGDEGMELQIGEKFDVNVVDEFTILYIKPQMSVCCTNFSQKPHHQF